jgi:hypothetical protein
MLREFRDRDISFAFPARTMYLSPLNLKKIGFDPAHTADQGHQVRET